MGLQPELTALLLMVELMTGEPSNQVHNNNADLLLWNIMSCDEVYGY